MASNASIIQRVFTVGKEKALVLRGDEYYKPTGLGTNWTRLRIGLTYAFAGDIPNNLNNVAFFIGMCVHNRPYTINTGHCVGWVAPSLGSGGGAALTYNANSGNPYYSSSGFNAVSRINTVLLTSATGGSNIFVPTITGSALTRRAVSILDITKTNATTTTLVMYQSVLAHMSLELTDGDMYNAIEQIGTTPVLRDSSMQASGINALLYTEVAPGLDSVNIYWPKWSFPMEIYNIAVYQVI